MHYFSNGLILICSFNIPLLLEYAVKLSRATSVGHNAPSSINANGSETSNPLPSLNISGNAPSTNDFTVLISSSGGEVSVEGNPPSSVSPHNEDKVAPGEAAESGDEANSGGASHDPTKKSTQKHEMVETIQCTSQGRIAIKDECTKFYACSGPDIHATIMSCPEKRVFHHQLRTCLKMPKEECEHSMCKSKEEKFSDPYTKENYLSCKHMYPELISCGKDEIFSATKHKCIKGSGMVDMKDSEDEADENPRTAKEKTTPSRNWARALEWSELDYNSKELTTVDEGKAHPGERPSGQGEGASQQGRALEWRTTTYNSKETHDDGTHTQEGPGKLAVPEPIVQAAPSQVGRAFEWTPMDYNSKEAHDNAAHAQESPAQKASKTDEENNSNEAYIPEEEDYVPPPPPPRPANRRPVGGGRRPPPPMPKRPKFGAGAGKPKSGIGERPKKPQGRAMEWSPMEVEPEEEEDQEPYTGPYKEEEDYVAQPVQRPKTRPVVQTGGRRPPPAPRRPPPSSKKRPSDVGRTSGGGRTVSGGRRPQGRAMEWDEGEYNSNEGGGGGGGGGDDYVQEKPQRKQQRPVVGGGRRPPPSPARRPPPSKAKQGTSKSKSNRRPTEYRSDQGRTLQAKPQGRAMELSPSKQQVQEGQTGRAMEWDSAAYSSNENTSPLEPSPPLTQENAGSTNESNAAGATQAAGQNSTDPLPQGPLKSTAKEAQEGDDVRLQESPAGHVVAEPIPQGRAMEWSPVEYNSKEADTEEDKSQPQERAAKPSNKQKKDPPAKKGR